MGNARYVTLTKHARQRMDSRRIGEVAVAACVAYGRVCHTRGAIIYVVGRREVERWRHRGIDLRRHEGIHVVCTPERTVLTVYRNRRLRDLRPYRRR